MGEIAERGADVVFVTSDNPRSEDPAAIAADILRGMQQPALARVELDRATAIRAALACAGPGDTVLVAGKGHEATQTTGTIVLPFDDVAVVRDVLGVNA
jgi:UDP-N-acetylmuramoyl-L-alanyl-D-glutamate--2,6-diaminopimelate ligase